VVPRPGEDACFDGLWSWLDQRGQFFLSESGISSVGLDLGHALTLGEPSIWQYEAEMCNVHVSALRERDSP
jgi:hypothetical protein